MDTRNNDFDFDFTPIGQAIKKARTAKGMTREQLARIVDYDPRHLQAIENEGQKPSLELFIQLVTMFGVSVDEYIFPDNTMRAPDMSRREKRKWNSTFMRSKEFQEALNTRKCFVHPLYLSAYRSGNFINVLLANFLCKAKNALMFRRK